MSYGMLGLYGILGIFIGSFLNLLIDRLYRNEQILLGRSHCDNCKHPLYFLDLIPLLSFVLLGGKCRYCKKPIGWLNPVVEVVTGVSFGVLEAIWGFNLIILSLAVVFIIVFFSDLKYGVVYQEVILVGVVAVLLLWVIGETRGIGEIVRNLIGATGAFLFFWILHKAFKGKAMGRGDADIAFLVGLVTGFPLVIISLLSSFLTGATIGLILIAIRTKRLKDKIPFGPFLVLGAVFGLLFGNNLLDWYKGLLGF